MKTGLVMEGGAMRGLFTCGVLDVFMENRIRFDAAAGISAGAVFGCNYKSGQIGRPLRYNITYSRDPRYCSFRSLLKTGDLYGADFCYRELPDVLDPFDRETFQKNPMEFFIGATDVDSGEIRFHKCEDGGQTDMLWMRASASMPVVSRIVEVDGFRLLDGGIVDPVPFHFMEEAGFDRNVLILTQPENYRKERSHALPLLKLALRNTPKVAEVMSVRHDVYNRQMEEIEHREARGDILVIRPPESLGIGRTESDPEKLKHVYQIGRREAVKALPAVKEFLDAAGE